VRSHKSIKTKKNHYSSGSRYCRRLGSHTLSTMPKISSQASQAFNPSTRQPGSNTTAACSSGTRYCRRLGTTASRSSRIHSNCYHFFYNRRPQTPIALVAETTTTTTIHNHNIHLTCGEALLDLVANSRLLFPSRMSGSLADRPFTDP